MNKTSIVNNLTATVARSVLDSTQGKILLDLITALSVVTTTQITTLNPLLKNTDVGWTCNVVKVGKLVMVNINCATLTGEAFAIGTADLELFYLPYVAPNMNFSVKTDTKMSKGYIVNGTHVFMEISENTTKFNGSFMYITQ